MDNNTEIDISEYYQTPLSSLTFPEKYAKLIKRIMNLNDSLVENLLFEPIETIGDIFRLEPYEFSKYPGIGKHYVDTLVELKKELPDLLKKLQQETDFIFKDDVFTLPNTDYSFETPITELALSPKYQKLIKRILAVVENINTVQDIVDIDAISFSELPYIGKSYVDLLIKLQNTFAPKNNNQLEDFIEELEEELHPKITLSTEQLEVPLNTIPLVSTQYQRLIKRISSAIGDVSTVKDIIDIDPVFFSNLPAVGKNYVNQLIELQSKLPGFLESKLKKSAFFNENYSIDFNEIDNILLEDVENYLWTLDERKMDIALSRWGFNQKHETLDEVGKRFNLTRERVRQIEKPINSNLPLNFRIPPKILWANIREKMTEDLTVLLPNLAKCFSTGKLFYEFIELCCQVESGSIQEIVFPQKIVFPQINPKIIHQLFCTNQSPIELEVIINELVSNYGYSKAEAINGINNLINQEKLEITKQGIYPRNMGKQEAVAHVLTFHPAGLPWKDIARIMNKKGYSKTPFDENRTASGFHDSEFVYLCGLGTFRNLIFLDIEQFNIPKIMQHLLSYFKKNQLAILHLHDYYYQTKNQRDEIEYFTLRHLVRVYGEEYGLYFYGKSGTDSISLDSNVTLISQADVIIKVLNESKVALTKQEIAERLKSKSTAHATFYINNLTEKGKVVRIDKMVYTTPEKAFSNVDIKAIMQVIQDIMNASDNVIVEADVFREYVNMELNLSYSKYFYSALVITQLKELAWHRNNTLFSKNIIPYKNLAEICRQLCNSELSVNENVKILQQLVWITDSVAINALQWWKWRMNH